jgi:magnesium-protoporphyrin O-methyltransferase
MLDLTQHKAQLQAYFDGIGFERWAAIYGDAQLSRVRRSIRAGHTLMLARAAAWLDEANLPTGAHVLDAGCGTGLFSLALARRGLRVTAVDLAPQMIAAAQQQAERAGLAERISFHSGDLEQIDGRFDAVFCFDVLVHYPQPGFGQLCTRLAQRSRGPLLMTYAPHSSLLAALHWLGGRFPHGQRRTEIQMIPDRQVQQALAEGGMAVRRRARISRGFYHVSLLEARSSGA